MKHKSKETINLHDPEVRECLMMIISEYPFHEEICKLTCYEPDGKCGKCDWFIECQADVFSLMEKWSMIYRKLLMDIPKKPSLKKRKRNKLKTIKAEGLANYLQMKSDIELSEDYENE